MRPYYAMTLSPSIKFLEIHGAFIMKARFFFSALLGSTLVSLLIGLLADSSSACPSDAALPCSTPVAVPLPQQEPVPVCEVECTESCQEDCTAVPMAEPCAVFSPGCAAYPANTIAPEPVVPVYQGPVLYTQPAIVTPIMGQFVCDESNYAPTTMFYGPEGVLPVIHWVSHYFAESGYSPSVRCQEVSRRFQRYYDAGVLNYITTGVVNQLPVVCVSSTLGGACGGVLFTLRPDENASQVIQQLFNISYANAGPLYESGSRIYLDVNEYLSTAMGTP